MGNDIRKCGMQVTLFSSVSYIAKSFCFTAGRQSSWTVAWPGQARPAWCEPESLKDKQTSKSFAGTFNFSPGELEFIKAGTSSSIFI